MEAGTLIQEAAQQCVKGFTQCLEVPALMENEWAENRLADMNLWISGTGACARGRASLDSRLASRPEARDVVANLLRLLGTVIDECQLQSHTKESSYSRRDEEEPASSEHEGPGRPFSPWSDDSSSDDQSEDGHDARGSSGNPLLESMRNTESLQDQLARIAVAIRRSGRRSRLQKADQRFDATEHHELEGHLIAMLLIQLKSYPQERDPSKLNEVQLRLIRCNLKRRNRFLYAQKHSTGLDAGFIRRANHVAIPKPAGSAQQEIIVGEMIRGELTSKPPNNDLKHANSTIFTGTSASKLSDNFNLPQPAHTAPAASSIMSITAVDLDYPRPPRFEDDARLFRCPCCCEALPATMAEKNRWRKHIADDLSPYTCILVGCDKPDVLFNTKEGWRRHILKDHSSMTYWICFACGEGPQFNDKEAFVQHTKASHAATISPDQIPVLVELSKKTTPTEIRRCPLCNWPEEEGVDVDKDLLLNHIAKDIHSFSLRALPWADDNGQESDERIHDCSEKVCEWLIQNEIQADPNVERPSREKKTWHSDYFQQNGYFAGSSKASTPSEPDSDRSREIELEELGEDHPDTLTDMASLGELYYGEGKLKEAEEMYLRALEGYKALSPDDPSSLRILANLGSVYYAQGELKEAEMMYQQALANYKDFGPGYLPLDAFNNLGSIYLNQGKLTEAEEMYLRALGGHKALDPDHPSTLDVLANLGSLYSEQGKLKEAEETYQQTLAGLEKVIGPDRLPTLDVLAKLGSVYYDQGELKEAEEMYLRALGGYKALDPDQLPTFDVLANLGSLYSEQGKLKEAEEVYQQALAGREKALGPDFPHTLDIVNNLGNLYSEQGKLKEAEKMYQRALAGREKVLGPDHPSTLDTVNNLGNLYSNQGKLKEAEEMYQRALAGYEKAFGPDHTRTRRLAGRLNAFGIAAVK